MSVTKEKNKGNGSKDAGNAAAGTQAPTVSKAVSELALYKRDVVDAVATKVEQYIKSGEINLPKNYDPNNAIKSAWLILQGVTDKDGAKALTFCTRDSVANSLLDMIVQGLNPMKKQCYFIVYGKTLVCQRSYFGAQAVAMMVEPRVKDFAQQVVYAEDTFKYGISKGKKIVQEHVQDIDNVDKTKIKAAYCIALDKDGEPFRTEVMTYEEILQAWKQSKIAPVEENGKLKAASVHSKFTADMAIKTVTNRCTKAIINASSDNALLLERINRNEDLTDSADARAEIDEHANTGDILDIETEEIKEAVIAEYKCPDAEGKPVSKSFCENCPKHDGCPEFNPEDSQQMKSKGPGW